MNPKKLLLILTISTVCGSVLLYGRRGSRTGSDIPRTEVTQSYVISDN